MKLRKLAIRCIMYGSFLLAFVNAAAALNLLTRLDAYLVTFVQVLYLAFAAIVCFLVGIVIWQKGAYKTSKSDDATAGAS